MSGEQLELLLANEGRSVQDLPFFI